MNTYRKTAISVGVLFIMATVLNMLGNIPLNTILDAPDYLISIAANENQVIVGSLLVLLSAFACAGIAIGLYPVIKQHHEALALGSVGLRVMEGMLYIIGVVSLLSLLTLSQEYVQAGASNTYLFQVSGTMLLAIKTWAGQSAVIAFTLGATMYYYVFYQSKLIPRWLSVWGFIGVSFSLAATLLTIFGWIIPFSPVFMILHLTILVQEMVLAMWLIVKGFNLSAITGRPAERIERYVPARP